MNTSYPKGSEWRKWDLHIHAPRTKQNDQFRATNEAVLWDEYCRRLHDSEVQAFGIADYFSADCYFSTVREYKQRYPHSPKTYFPNVEIRTNDVVNAAQEEVNIHLLFNPFLEDYEGRLESFLHALKTNKTNEQGRNLRASDLDNESDYSAATTTRQFVADALTETFGKAADLLEHVLVISAANNNGIRSPSGARRKALITDEIDKFSNAFFGNANNVAYFQQPNRTESKDEYTKPKPVFSGSDAHSLKDLDERLGQVTSAADGNAHAPTWIKADPTFEGLRQTVFEPENRVFIGREPEVETRVRQNGTRYIKSLQIDRVDGYQDNQHGAWFCDETIPFGKELVAIIGNKGSGKSAVTDVIGLLGNSHNQLGQTSSASRSEELFSFLNRDKFRKGGCASHFHATLNWYEGDPDSRGLDEETDVHLPEKVEYLPQKYLERICANIADDEFRMTLNEVIFRYVKPSDRHEQPDLDSLIKYLTTQAKKDITAKKEVLHRANDRVASVETKLTAAYRKQLEEKIRQKREEIEAHEKARPPERPEPTEDTSAETTEIDHLKKEISDLREQIEKRKAEMVEAKATVEQLRQTRQAIDREAAKLLDLESEHGAILESVGLSFGQVVRVVCEFGDLDAVTQRHEDRSTELEALLATEDEIAARSDGNEEAARTARKESLVCCLMALEAQRAAKVEQLGRSAREYQQYLNELAAWGDRDLELRGADDDSGVDTLKGMQRELEKIDSEYAQALIAAQEAQESAAKRIFEKRKGLTTFYNSVKRSIDAEITNCRKDLGEYDISIEAGLRCGVEFSDEFFRFIDQSVVGSFRGKDEGRARLRAITDNVTDWEDETQVFEALGAVTQALRTDERNDGSPSRDVEKQMKGQKTVAELYDYLFGFDYLRPKYDLKVDGKDLSELSPGERGGLLLVFYLMLDRQETPLIVDQPEDNLDNKSVYEVLAKFIKRAKKRRQIILVTHNPNLAVVADAEQVIHVSIDKTDGQHDFDFFAGGIEDPLINATVVDILEGTRPAFDNRRLKYRTHRLS